MENPCLDHGERLAKLEEKTSCLEEIKNDLKAIKRNLAFACGFLAALQILVPFLYPQLVQAFNNLF